MRSSRFLRLVVPMIGAVLCYCTYKKQFDEHDDPGGTLGIFATGPRIPHFGWNLVTEIIGTFVLILWILLDIGAACQQAVLRGGLTHITDSMWLVLAFHSSYVLDSLYNEVRPTSSLAPSSDITR